MALTKITPQMFDTSATTHDLNVDNGTFVVDGSASRVGIGTPTPSTLLDVNGALTATTIAGTTSVTTADFRYSGGAGYLTYALNQAGTDTLNIRRYGTVQQQFTQYGVNFPSGNIGIGATNPNTNLQLYHATDDISINVNHGTGGSYPKKSGISFGATSTSLGGDATFTGGAGIQVTNTAATNNPTEMAFFTTSGGAPTTRMLINSDGEVGIGETNPQFPLHVKSSGTDIAKFESSGSYTFTRFSSSSRNWALSIGSSFSIYDETGSQTLLALDSSGNLSLQGTAVIQPSGASLLPSLKLNNNGYLGSASTPTAIQIATGGDVVFAGNITAGTRLISLADTVTNEGGHVLLRANTGGAKQYSIDVDTGNLFRIIAEDDNTGANGFVIASADGSGNFFISTASANPHTLTSGGGTKFFNNVGSLLAIARDSQTVIAANRSGSSPGTVMDFRMDGTIKGTLGVSSSGFIINESGGNVGINDTDPDRKVSIIGDSTSSGQYPLSLDATNTDYALEFRRSGTSEWWIKASASNFTVHENGVGDQFTVYSGSARVYGLLGVNKAANPSVGLSVGSDASTTSSYALEVTNSSANTRFLVDGVGNSYFYKNDNNVGMKFDATNGRLGIGTGAGAVNYPLTVSGESSLGDFSANGFANLGRNADGNQDVTTLGGYGVDAGSGTRYGRYGVLRFRSSANYTSGSRGYMITNGYGANKFAILQSSSATTMPSLGSYGGVSGGTAPFIMDSSGDITMGYQPAAYGRITGNITSPGQDYGIALTTDYYRNITAQTNSTHGPGLTITRAGVYIMSMSFLYDPVGTYVYVGWCVNGTIIHHYHSNHAIANNHDAHSSIARYLNVGDHLTIERTTANGITTIYGNSHSYWWVCKVG